MGITVEELEKAIRHLPQDQLKQFRAWYESFDSDARDEQIEKDAVAGKLDSLTDAALANYQDGKAKEL